MEYIIAIIIGYLCGCSHMSYYISKLKKIDIKNNGSKNYGASNTMALLGWKYGILTGIHDIAKAIIAICIVKALYPTNEYLLFMAGVMSVIGHIFPFYLKFDGGKGFATFIGMTFALDWRIGIIVGILTIILTITTDYIVMGTFSTIILVPICMGILNNDIIITLILLIATIIIFYKHKENIKRLRNGTEMKFSKANKKEYKTNK